MSYPDIYPDAYPADANPALFPIPQTKPFEWYTLDDSLHRDQIIEGFHSFIWTERYSAAGDFQIVTRSTFENRRLLTKDTFITMDKSQRVMKIESISDDTDDQGLRNLTVTGKSIENILNDRVAMPVVGDTTTTPNWVLTGTPGDIARQLFHDICVTTVLDSHDSIPFYVAGSLNPAGNLDEPSDVITVTASPDTLYNTLKQVCDAYDLGFRLVKNGDAGELYFEVYVGNDLTGTQSVLPAVIFDPSMENLSKISQLTSTEPVKTVAYVYASNGSAIVFAPGTDTSASGFNRRILLVNSGNNDDAGPALDTALQQEGILALAAQKEIYAFDGELPQQLSYVYGEDYNLGDLVEERTSDGYGGFMLVTEQIFVSDDAGDRAYPTLVAVSVITPGSWASEGAIEWSTISPTLEWEDA